MTEVKKREEDESKKYETRADQWRRHVEGRGREGESDGDATTRPRRRREMRCIKIK